MGELPRMGGYLQVSYLAECQAELGAMEKRIVNALRSGSTSPVEYIQAIGDLLAMIRDARGDLERAQSVARSNGYVDQLVDPVAQVEASLAAVRSIVEGQR